MREAVEEGITIVDATQVVAFQGENNKFSHIECMRTAPGAPDANGIAWPVFAEGQQSFTLAFDRAFVAIGQVGGFNSKTFAGRIAVSERGFIETDQDLHTSHLHVYAAGDSVSGPSSVVKAMASGRKAARTIHFDLTGEKEEQSVSRPESKDFRCIPEDLPKQQRTSMPERQAAERASNFHEVALGFNALQMTAEAQPLPAMRRLFRMPAVRGRLRCAQSHRPFSNERRDR